MVFPRSVYGCADERAGNFYTFFNVVRSAANLEYAFISAIGFAYGKVRTLDGLAFCNLAHDDAGNIFAYIDKFFNFESATEKFILQFFCGNVYINVIFKPT